MKIIHQNIWYADEKRASNPKKILMYSDRGTLESHTSGLRFAGQNSEIAINSISKVRRGRPTLNWVAYLAGGAIFAFLDFAILPGPDPVFGREWVLTSLYILLAPVSILLFYLPVKWVTVEYEEQGRKRKAWFSSGDAGGFSVYTGANHKLKRDISAAIESHQTEEH